MLVQLIFATLRSDRSGFVDRVKSMFSSKARPTWIFVEPLTYNAILNLTSRTLHRSKEDCAELARFVHRASSGNAFSARSVLTTLQRQNQVCSICFSFSAICLLSTQIRFNIDKNHWE